MTLTPLRTGISKTYTELFCTCGGGPRQLLRSLSVLLMVPKSPYFIMNASIYSEMGAQVISVNLWKFCWIRSYLLAAAEVKHGAQTIIKNTGSEDLSGQMSSLGFFSLSQLW